MSHHEVSRDWDKGDLSERGMDRKMTEAEQRPAVSGLALVLSAWHDPAARILNVDLVTVLIAFLLPWSTTGVVIAAALWVIALVPTLDMGALLRSLKRPVSALPIAIFALALAGTLWSDASWANVFTGSDRPRDCWCCRYCFIMANARREARGFSSRSSRRACC
jgi:hypothetical protein